MNAKQINASEKKRNRLVSIFLNNLFLTINLLVIAAYWYEGRFYFPFETSAGEAWVVKSYVEQKSSFFKTENVQHIIYNYQYNGTEYAGTGELRSIYALKGDTVKIKVLRRNPKISKLITY